MIRLVLHLRVSLRPVVVTGGSWNVVTQRFLKWLPRRNNLFPKCLFIYLLWYYGIICAYISV